MSHDPVTFFLCFEPWTCCWYMNSELHSTLHSLHSYIRFFGWGIFGLLGNVTPVSHTERYVALIYILWFKFNTCFIVSFSANNILAQTRIQLCLRQLLHLYSLICIETVMFCRQSIRIYQFLDILSDIDIQILLLIHLSFSLHSYLYLLRSNLWKWGNSQIIWKVQKDMIVN